MAAPALAMFLKGLSAAKSLEGMQQEGQPEEGQSPPTLAQQPGYMGAQPAPAQQPGAAPNIMSAAKPFSPTPMSVQFAGKAKELMDYRKRQAKFDEISQDARNEAGVDRMASFEDRATGNTRQGAMDAEALANLIRNRSRRV